MPETARAPFHSRQTLALIESNPLSSVSWEELAEKIRGENDPLSLKSLEVIIRGLKKREDAQSSGQKTKTGTLSEVSQSMFVRLARAFNSPTLLKEVGLIYLRDLGLPGVALEHFERSLLLGGPVKELRPLTEAAAVAVQRQIARDRGEQPQLSGMTSAQPTNIVATTIIRRTGKMLMPTSFGQGAGAQAAPAPAAKEEISRPLPNETAGCLSEAKEACRSGLLSRAEALLRKANEAPTGAHEMWQAWTDLGQAAFDRRDYVMAQSAFSEALKYQPEELASHFNAALGYHLNEKFDKALAAYTRADQLQTRNAKVWCNMGALYFQMDDYSRAEQTLRGAVEADPQYARAWDNLAAALGAQDKLDEALAACERTVQLRAEYPEARFKMGVIHFCRNEWEQALEEFARASALPALGSYCEAFLAMIYARLAQTEAAETAVRRAAELDPKCDLLWMAWNDVGLALFADEQYPRAAEAYAKASSKKPDQPDAWFNLGASFHQAGDLPKARDAYQRSVDLNRLLPEGWHNLGIVCAELGDLHSAVAAFKKETACAPDNQRAWYDLGVASEKLGEPATAADAFARAEALGSEESAREAALQDGMGKSA